VKTYQVGTTSLAAMDRVSMTPTDATEKIIAAQTN